MSLGGILKYPEDGELEIKSMPVVTHTVSGYVYDNNEEDNQEILSHINVPSILPDVICFHFLFCSDDILTNYASCSIHLQIPMSTSLDPFLKLIKNIEELENEWRKEPNIDQILRLPVHIGWESIFYCVTYIVCNVIIVYFLFLNSNIG